MKDILEWWTKHHSGHQFMVQPLGITHQQDIFSCGLLSFNALAHHFLPDSYPLINAMLVANGQLEMMLEVIEQHLDQSFESISENFEFTSTAPEDNTKTAHATPQSHSSDSKSKQRYNLDISSDDELPMAEKQHTSSPDDSLNESTDDNTRNKQPHMKCTKEYWISAMHEAIQDQAAGQCETRTRVEGY
ncbi:hypothetical protein F4604DRAFT_1677975 [Suillus subluteus]|nr:hypothetical protein F4604DRAFT_1677975 [Suillus subluteus]